MLLGDQIAQQIGEKPRLGYQRQTAKQKPGPQGVLHLQRPPEGSDVIKSFFWGGRATPTSEATLVAVSQQRCRSASV